jgi:16S rRNA (uracil1498-N3)-methyltransferase
VEVHFVEPGLARGPALYIEGAEARHIVKVLRHGPGDELVFTDGTGRFIDARIDRCDPASVHAEITGTRPDPREDGAPWSTIGLALLKGDHFEIALEKMVELGVHRIVPLTADHCVVKLKDRAVVKKLERWQRIADSAMKQSGRSWRCEVAEPATVREAVERYGPGADVIVADEAETSELDPRTEPGRPHLGLVGPEGAFSEREKEWLERSGARRLSLGPFRLRAETAAITLAATLNRGRSHG